jgi:hypothetical protein
MKLFLDRRVTTALVIAFLLGLGILPSQASARPSALEEFPKRNVWARITPSVSWCNDPNSKVTIEVHITGRNDVRKVWVANLVGAVPGEPLESFDDNSKGLAFFDDGTHGDAMSGDNVFTRNNLVLPCSLNPTVTTQLRDRGWSTWWGYVRVGLADGRRQGEIFGMIAGLIDSKYKNAFAVHDFGSNLSATSYAFFIQDAKHEVMDDYPVATVYCGTTNFNAYRKLYSVFPDIFDIGLVTPGLQILRPKDLLENVPYDVLVSNAVQHIGLPITNETAEFGSAGRLKSVVYHSFGDVGISTHEIGHTWGMNIGASLGLLDKSKNEQSLGHWNAMADIGGEMSSYYIDSTGRLGLLHFNGDDIWRLVPNTEWEPYSPLELYTMGLISPGEVPPVHILQSPNTADWNKVTAASYKTITIDQIMAAEGGARVPAAAGSQKDFNLAFIVTQDQPYTDASYAFFSLMAHSLMSTSPPTEGWGSSSFYWATGGRAKLNTRLPVDVAEPFGLPGSSVPSTTQSTGFIQPPTENKPAQQTKGVATPHPPAENTPAVAATRSPICNCPLLVGGMTILPGALYWFRRKRKEN